jgi:hypothetical protein
VISSTGVVYEVCLLVNAARLSSRLISTNPQFGSPLSHGATSWDTSAEMSGPTSFGSMLVTNCPSSQFALRHQNSAPVPMIARFDQVGAYERAEQADVRAAIGTADRAVNVERNADGDGDHVDRRPPNRRRRGARGRGDGDRERRQAFRVRGMPDESRVR